MDIDPLHPGHDLTRYQVVSPSHYLIPGATRSGGADQGVGDDAIDALLSSHREGIEHLVNDVGRLLEERCQAGTEIVSAIDRDHLYLENLILDRYRHGERPTDDPVYVKLRLQQLGLESERRREGSACWRDTVLLAKEQSELLRRADDARRREALLGGDES
jgi:hypothetical protein